MSSKQEQQATLQFGSEVSDALREMLLLKWGWAVLERKKNTYSIKPDREKFSLPDEIRKNRQVDHCEWTVKDS